MQIFAWTKYYFNGFEQLFWLSERVIWIWETSSLFRNVPNLVWKMSNSTENCILIKSPSIIERANQLICTFICLNAKFVARKIYCCSKILKSQRMTLSISTHCQGHSLKRIWAPILRLNQIIRWNKSLDAIDCCQNIGIWIANH